MKTRIEALIRNGTISRVADWAVLGTGILALTFSIAATAASAL